MSEKNDDIIDSVDVFYEKLGKGNGKALILLSIQNWLYNIIKFDEITGNEVYSSLDEMLYKTQYNIDNFKNKKANDFLSMIIDYVESASYYLIQNLNSSIVRQYEYIHFGQVKEIDNKSIQKLAQKSGRNTKQKIASDPRIYAVKKQFSYDIIENRVLKEFLHTLKTLLDMKISALGNDIENKENIFLDIINSFLQSNNALSIGDYKTIKVNNVLLRDKHYKKIWKSWSRLKDLDYIINKSNHFLDDNIITYMYYSIISMLSRTDDYYIIQSSFQLGYDKISEENIYTKDIEVFKKYDNKVIDLKIKNNNEKIKNNILIYNNENSEVIVGIKNNVITVVKNMLTDEIIELGNQNIKKEYSIITKTYEITNDNINNLIKELYYFITGFDNFKKDNILDPIKNNEQKEIFIDICSYKPMYMYNNFINIVPFRMLIQKKEDNQIIDCKIAKAINKEYETFDIIELFCKKDKDGQLEFNGKDIFFKNLKSYLKTEKLVYLLPDAIETIKIFESKHTISYINYVFHSSIRLPKSIAALLGQQIDHNKVYYFIDFVYDCPYITKIHIRDDKKNLYTYIPESNGYYFERHDTKEIEELKINYNFNYNDLIIFNNDSIISKNEISENIIDYKILEKYIDNKKDFILLCNNIKVDNVVDKDRIIYVNTKKMLHSCQKFYRLYKLLEEKKVKNLSIWYDYLPQLALTCVHSDGYYYDIDIINDSVINPYSVMENIEINKIFMIPKNKREITFPLIMGNSITTYEASINLEEPFENKIECTLELHYSYGKEEPYKLYFKPINIHRKLEVNWKKITNENVRPAYPPIVSWEKVVKFPDKNDVSQNLLNTLISKLIKYFKENDKDIKVQKTISFCCYKIWGNGKSILDKDCPSNFREYINKFIQKHINDEYNDEFFYYITSIMHKDAPEKTIKIIRDNLDAILSLSKNINHMKYSSIGYALGDISKDWQKEILRKISNVKINKINRQSFRAILQILAIAIWRTENAHREIYAIFNENNKSFLKLLITKNIIYDFIETEFGKIKYKINIKNENKNDFRELLQLYDLLFGIMLYNDAEKYPEFKNIFDPTSKIIRKYVQQLDKIWYFIVTKCDNYESESLNSFIKFDIQNMPKEFKDKNVPEIFFAVRSYLTGNFNGSTISIKEFKN